MTDMKRLFRHILPVITAFAVAACSGTIDPDAGGSTGNGGAPDGPEPGNGDENNPMTEVPDGVLRIFADKTDMIADGNDEVTFTVMFGKEDVSNARTLQLVREYEGEKKHMSYGANKFSTVTAGTYRFTAEYYYGGKHIADNSVEIEAKQFFSGEEKSYEQRVLGVYFTSTGCNSCPRATKGIKTLQEANPGKISVVAFHSHMGMVQDPMTIPETASFNAALGGFDGLPRLFWNMRTGTHLIGPSFTESYAEELAAYEPQCGLSVQAGDNGIDIGITSNIPSVYRYFVFVVEDGIVADQTGDPDYVHDNVVRAVLTSEKGDKINDNLPLSVGVEARATESLTLSPEWNKDNLRIVVAAATSVDGGYTFVVNNVAECRYGGSVGYQYAE